jgi:two-component system, sensor histidine kinase and response regulator
MTSERGHRASILIVDDTVDNLQVMAGMLTQQGYEARPVPSGKLALQAVANDPPDLILLDITMPGMNGYEVCEQLKADERSREIPVIFISALDETMDKVKAFGVGGCDYVTKPLHYEEVFARVESQLALRRARIELQRSYASLRELEQLRDNLVHMIVHDMRSPLGALLAIGYVLQQSLSEQPDRRHLRDLGMLLGSADRLRSMVDAVLDVSRLEAGRMPIERVEHDVVRIVSKVVDSLRALDPDRPISVFAPAAVRVACDESLVFRIVENLIGNGLHHTREGLSLRVSVFEEEGGGARVLVRDEGPGVPDELKAKIFDKFGAVSSRSGTEQRYHSVGLGLALCKLAVEAHGGKIGVIDNADRGSTFWFTLPRAT